MAPEIPWKVVLTTIVATLLVWTLVDNFTTSEKAIERKLRHRYPIADAQYKREMSVMLGPSIVRGNEVRVLQNGDEIFPAMLTAIRAAQTSINFETYIYWSGTIGKELADALSDRARAGVAVNVMIDWVGSMKMDEALLKQIEEAGARVHRYRPLKWYNLGRMNNRTHRKLLVVDGKVAFTGGVGVADQWRGNARGPHEWRDLHFVARGPVVSHFQSAFNDNWIKTTGEVLNGAVYFPPQTQAGESDAQLFISSPSGGSESMHLMFLMTIAAAAKQIDIQAAYFVPDDLTIGALLEARRRGVKIRITLPGKHIDSDTVRIASKAHWGELLKAGVEVYEYQPTMLHNKLLIVDEELVSVGSTNFDVRSFKLNDEASLNVYDTRFAATMKQIFEQDLKNTKQYSYEMWQARPWKEKFMEMVVLPIKSQL